VRRWEPSVPQIRFPLLNSVISTFDVVSYNPSTPPGVVLSSPMPAATRCGGGTGWRFPRHPPSLRSEPGVRARV
jgi:hypothetical protein